MRTNDTLSRRVLPTMLNSAALVVLCFVMVDGQCSSGECNASNEETAMLQMNRRSRVPRDSCGIGPGIPVIDFIWDNKCDVAMEVQQFNTTSGGFFEVPANTRIKMPTRPPCTKGPQGQCWWPGAPGCEAIPNVGDCYQSNVIQFKPKGWWGGMDGIEVASPSFFGSNSCMGIPDFAIWRGYSTPFSMIAYKAGTQELACWDAGAEITGTVAECAEAGGADISKLVNESLCHPPQPGSMELPNIGEQLIGAMCNAGQCMFVPTDDANNCNHPGSLYDCDSKATNFAKTHWYAVNGDGTKTQTYGGCGWGGNPSPGAAGQNHGAGEWCYNNVGYWTRPSGPPCGVQSCWDKSEQDSVGAGNKPGGIGWMYHCRDGGGDREPSRPVDFVLTTCPNGGSPPSPSPQPPPAPPAPPAPSPGPSPSGSWTKHDKNCYGKAGPPTDENPSDIPMPVSDLQACQQKCESEADCKAFVFGPPSSCYPKKSVDLSNCVPGGGYSTYTK